jgi:hypothetical protein
MEGWHLGNGLVRKAKGNESGQVAGRERAWSSSGLGLNSWQAGIYFE